MKLSRRQDNLTHKGTEYIRTDHRNGRIQWERLEGAVFQQVWAAEEREALEQAYKEVTV